MQAIKTLLTFDGLDQGSAKVTTSQMQIKKISLKIQITDFDNPFADPWA